MTAILGISAFYHDSAAALVIDGEIVAAAQEERFTRRKHDASYPTNAIKFCLKEAKLSLEQIDFIAFYDKPFLKFERLIETYVASAPKGFKSFRLSMPVWLREKLFLKNVLIKEIKKTYKGFNSEKLLFGEHHFSHAASAFYASPFNKAIVLTIDGVGEWATTSVSIGDKNKLDIIKEIHFPHSLGLLYSAFTYYIGFKVNSGEYKLMGLAPYGRPIYKELILDNLIDLKADGSFRLDQSYFNYTTDLTMTNQNFSDLFGQPVRKPNKDDLTQFHMDIASSIQAVTEEVIQKITRSLAKEYKVDNLCLAGGVALNCVSNGKIVNDRVFKDVWIQPAAGDAGGAIGGALAVWHKELNMPRIVNPNDGMKGAYLGPSYSQGQIIKELSESGAIYTLLNEQEMIDQTAKALSEGKAVGWFQGRMEFGPRALGARSILGDARSEKMQKTLNLKVKYRESFRPFAPSILSDDLNNWFRINHISPYMLLVDQVIKEKRIDMTEHEKSLFGIEKLNIKRSDIPAVTHVDYSARIQTVHKETNLIYYSLISKFKELTGCPVIVNTSFNVRGEPIVCSPSDAFNCFMGTDIEFLAIGNCILHKKHQDKTLNNSYKEKFELD